MTSTTAIPSFSVPPAALPQALSRRPQKAGRAAEPVRQLFEEAVEPVLTDRLPLAGLFWEQDLHEVSVAGAHGALRGRMPPGQLSSSVCVVTVSTCSPKRFM